MIAVARPTSLRALSARFGGAVDAGVDLDRVISTLGRSDSSEPCDLAPVLHERGAARISTVALLLVADRIAARVAPGRRWVHPDAEAVLAELLAAPHERPFAEAPVHPSARIDGAIIEPGARVGRTAIIGAGSRVEANAVIFPGVRIGRDCVIGAGSVVGRAGFGLLASGARIPHRAGVLIGDRVDLGALCTVDAGILAPTTIGDDSKLDAHVHVGHGVRIGARCRVAAQAGFAGSVVLEDDVLVGGQAGIADHCTIGRGARVAAKAGVIGDVAAGEVVAGYPAVARARWLRGHARLYRR